MYSVEQRQWTPMHYAAYYGRTRVASLLCKHGFAKRQLEFKDWENKTAVEIALRSNSDDIVAMLTGEREVNIDYSELDIENEPAPASPEEHSPATSALSPVSSTSISVEESAPTTGSPSPTPDSQTPKAKAVPPVRPRSSQTPEPIEEPLQTNDALQASTDKKGPPVRPRTMGYSNPILAKKLDAQLEASLTQSPRSDQTTTPRADQITPRVDQPTLDHTKSDSNFKTRPPVPKKPTLTKREDDN